MNMKKRYSPNELAKPIGFASLSEDDPEQALSQGGIALEPSADLPEPDYHQDKEDDEVSVVLERCE
jgi:hypothetical protein